MKGIYEMKKGAFTLAEVLLTLAIIGVVAAMTVPSLMTSTEDKKLGAAAKKAYNTLQNAITLKQAQTDLSPADITGVNAGNLMKFLCGGGDDHVRVLKTTEEALDSGIVQTPDGIIMRAGTGNCGTGETYQGGVNDPHCLVVVDVNGSEGPHFSGVTAGSTAAGAQIKVFNSGYVAGATSTYARANRDIVVFRVNGTNVYPDPADGATMRYIKGKNK